MRVIASVLSNEQEILTDVNVTNLENGKTTRTDAAGRFAIDVASGETLLKFTHVGFDYDTFKAKDIKSVVELYPSTLGEVNVQGTKKDSSNDSFLWLFGAAALYFGAKKIFGKKTSQPRKVTIR